MGVRTGHWSVISGQSLIVEDAGHGDMRGSLPPIGNFLRRLALHSHIKDWALRTMREKLVKLGGKVIHHGPYVTFQMAEVLVSNSLFHEMLERINRMKPVPVGFLVLYSIWKGRRI